MSDRSEPLGHEEPIRLRLQELIGDGTEREIALVVRIVRGFREKSSTILQTLETATATGDVGTAVQQLHLLRGTAVNLGLSSLAARCERLETAALDGGLPSPSERSGLRDGMGGWVEQLTRQADALLHAAGSGDPAHPPGRIS